jgi:hypothetical protein
MILFTYLYSKICLLLNTPAVNSCSVYIFRLISISLENFPPKVDIISILVMLEKINKIILYVLKIM